MPYPLEKYVGSHKHEDYGKAAVYVENGELQLNINRNYVWPLEYCFYNVFKGEFIGAPSILPIRVEFSLDLQGNVTSLEIQIEGTETNVVFNKISD